MFKTALCSFLAFLLFSLSINGILGSNPTVSSIHPFLNSSLSPTVSLGGGGVLQINGEAFEPTGYSQKQIVIGDSVECQVIHQYSSNSTIVCIIDEALMSPGQFGVEIYVDGQLASCEMAPGCFIQATESATPYLTGLYPVYLSTDETLRIKGLLRVDSYDLIQEVSIDSMGTQLAASQANQILDYERISEVLVFLPDDLSAGTHKIQFRGQPGTGYSLLLEALGDYDLGISPKINLITPTTMSPYGEYFTITGSGFSNDQQVYIGDHECVIHRLSRTQIECLYEDVFQTSSIATNASEVYLGGYGVKVERKDENGEEIETVILPSFEGRMTTAENVYKETYSSYFCPKKSGIHTFMYFGKGDDLVEVYTGSPIKASYSLFSDDFLNEKASSGSISDDTGQQKLLSFNASQHKESLNLADTESIWFPALASGEIYLTSGEFYQIKAERTGIRDEFFRIGVKQPTDSQNISCVPFSFKVSLKNQKFQNEVWRVDIFNVKSGKWEISIDDMEHSGQILKSQALEFNVDSKTLEEALQESLFVSSEVIVEYISSKGEISSSISIKEAVGYRFTISLLGPRETSSVPIVSSIGLEPADALSEVSLTLLRTQSPSEAVFGWFRLFIKTGWTDWLKSTASPEEIWKELVVDKSLLGTKTKVFRSGFAKSGYEFTFEVYDEDFSEDYIAVDGSRTANGASFEKYSAYDCKFTFNEAIPFDQLVQLTNNPTVVIKGPASGALCEPGVCQVTIKETGVKVKETVWEKVSNLTQKLEVSFTSSIPISDLESIELFTEDVEICSIDLDGLPSSGFSELSCEFNGFLAGVYKFFVRVSPYGLVPLLFEDSTMFKVSPSTETPVITPGYWMGKTLLEVSGSCFNDDASETRVYISSDSEYPCDLVELSQSSLKCLTYAPFDQKLSIYISMKGKVTTLANAFRYTTTSRPEILSVNRTTASPVEPVALLIEGSGFGESVTNASVVFFKTDFNESGVTEECFVTEVTSTKIACILSGGTPGAYFMVVSRLGYGPSMSSILDFDAANPGSAILFYMEVYANNASISNGSYAGGSYLTIQGENFSPLVESTQVYFGNPENSQTCQVYQVTSNELKCKTLPLLNMELIDTPLQIRVFTKDSEEAVYSKGEFFFNFSSSETPIVTEIIPLAIKKSQTFVVRGSGLSANPKMLFTSEEVFLTYDSQHNYYTGVFPSLEASRFMEFDLLVSSDTGNAAKSDNFTFNNILAVDSMSTNKMSQGGGYLNISGSGFSQNHLFLFGTEEKVNCTLTSLSKTQVICLVGQFNQNADLPLVIYDKTKESNAFLFTCEEPSCFLKFTTSLTPKIRGFGPSIVYTGNFDLTVEIKDEDTLKPIENPENVHMYLQREDSSFELVESEAIMALDDTNLSFSCSFSNISFGYFRPLIQVEPWGFSLNNLNNEFLVTFDSGEVNGSAVSSYNGGASLTLRLDEEGSVFLPSQVSVKVCGIDCPISAQGSFSLECLTPSLNTRDFQETYQWAEPREFLLTDNELPVSVISDSKNKDKEQEFFWGTTGSFYSSESLSCFIGFELHDGMELQFASISFLLPEQADLSSFIGMEIQISSDGAIWESLAKFTESLSRSWNLFVPDDLETTAKFLRFAQDDSASKCQISTMKFTGFLFKSTEDLEVSRDNSITCEVEIETESGFSVGVLPNVAVKYEIEKSFSITEVSPSQAEASGGTNVTITFDKEGLGSTGSEIPKVLFEGVQSQSCSWVSGSSSKTSQLVCLTGAHEEKDFEESILVQFSFGKASSKDVFFQYIYDWSSSVTWGGESPPGKGKEAFIPKGKTVLLDQNTPALSSLVIEGVLVFDPNQEIELVSQSIVIGSGGKLQIGTSENPRNTSIPAIITLVEGDEEGNSGGSFGAKGIICGQGEIQMFGAERQKAFSVLAKSAKAGDYSLELQEEVDWVAGEVIVVASSSQSPSENEEMTIWSVGEDNKTLSFSSPLEFTHEVFSESINGTQVVYSPEVAVLNRSIVIRGDSISWETDNGVYLTISQSCSAQLNSVEVYNAGQAGQIGRCPIHFQYMGVAENSFIKHSSIHHSFNRGISIQGTSYLTVEDNLIYDTKGHSLLLEDGSEEFNKIKGNLVIKTTKNWSKWNFDPEPASFWIRNPRNFLTENRAVASESFGFWFDLPERPGGLSSSIELCVKGLGVGSFDGNQAHSNSKVGLLISEYIPRENPCGNWDDVEENPGIPVYFSNFKGFSHSIAGAVVSRPGSLILHSWILSSNGIGVSFDSDLASGLFQAQIAASEAVTQLGETSNPKNDLNSKNLYIFAKIEDSFITGTSSGSSFGVIGPKISHVKVQNSAFYHFSIGSALKNSIETQNISFDGSSVRFTLESFAVIRDLDGSLMPFSDGGGWLLSPLDYLAGSSCQQAENEMVVCDKNENIRRVSVKFTNNQESLNEESLIVSFVDGPFGSESHSTEIPYDPEQASWSFPVVSGSIYSLFWPSQPVLDGLFITSSECIQEDEPPVYFQLSYSSTDSEFLTGGTEISLDSLPSDPRDCLLPNGDYVNNKFIQNLLVVYGPTQPNDPFAEKERTLLIQEKGCSEEDCSISINQPSSKPSTSRLWSDPDSWASGGVPSDGDEVIIESTWWMILDESTADLGSLEILGTLSIDPDSNGLVLKSKKINLRENGHFLVGSEENSFKGTFIVELSSEADDLLAESTYKEISDALNAFIVSGELEIHGASAEKTSFSHLSSNLKAGSSTLSIRDAGTNWEVGDEIVISVTDYLEGHTERFTIESINGSEIGLNKAASYNHFGSTSPIYSNEEIGELDMAAEVGLLSRNVKIIGTDSSSVGGVIINSRIEAGENAIEGVLRVQGVEFVNMGQKDTELGALNFISNKVNRNVVQNCSIHDSNGPWIIGASSSLLTVSNNVFYKGVRSGIKFIDGPTTDSFVGNNLFLTLANATYGMSSTVTDLSVLIHWDTTGSPGESKTVIADNRLADAQIMMALPFPRCYEANTVFRNTLHNGRIGLLGLDRQESSGKSEEAPNEPLEQGENSEASSSSCFYMADVVAFKLREDGIIAYLSSTQIHLQRSILAANKNGVTLNQGAGSLVNSRRETHIQKCVFYGYTDLADSDQVNLAGVRVSVTTEQSKGFFPKPGQLPYYKPESTSLLNSRLFVRDCHVYKHTYLKNVTFMQLNYFAGEGSAIVSIESLYTESTTTNDLFFFTPERNYNCPTILNCTGFSNVLISMKQQEETYDIFPLGGSSGASGNLSQCSSVKSWEGFMCTRKNNEEFLLLGFQAAEENEWTGEFSPVYLTRAEIDYKASLNSGVDWYGSSFIHRNAFQVVLPSSGFYQVSSSASFFSRSTYSLYSSTDSLQHIVLEIPLESKEFGVVFLGGTVISPSIYDEISSDSSGLMCGMNTFDSSKNSMKLVITSEEDCLLTLQKTAYVSLEIDFDYPVTEFLEVFSISEMVSTLAEFLEIPSTKIQPSRIQEGSTKVSFNLLNEDTPYDQNDDLNEAIRLGIEKDLLDFGLTVQNVVILSDSSSSTTTIIYENTHTIEYEEIYMQTEGSVNQTEGEDSGFLGFSGFTGFMVVALVFSVCLLFFFSAFLSLFLWRLKKKMIISRAREQGIEPKLKKMEYSPKNQDEERGSPKKSCFEGNSEEFRQTPQNDEELDVESFPVKETKKNNVSIDDDLEIKEESLTPKQDSVNFEEEVEKPVRTNSLQRILFKFGIVSKAEIKDDFGSKRSIGKMVTRGKEKGSTRDIEVPKRLTFLPTSNEIQDGVGFKSQRFIEECVNENEYMEYQLSPKTGANKKLKKEGSFKIKDLIFGGLTRRNKRVPTLKSIQSPDKTPVVESKPIIVNPRMKQFMRLEEIKHISESNYDNSGKSSSSRDPSIYSPEILLKKSTFNQDDSDKDSVKRNTSHS